MHSIRQALRDYFGAHTYERVDKPRGEFFHTHWTGTGDQLYEEEQFEAYRALGECAMEGMFRDEIVGKSQPRLIRDWFQSIANNLLPDNDEAFGRTKA